MTDYREFTEKKDLIKYGREELSMMIPHDLSVDEMIEKISKGLGDDKPKPKKTRAKRKPATAKTEDKPPTRITILIPKTDKEKGPVFVGVQGVGYTIPRGKKVDVKPELVHVLELAITKTVDPETGEIGEVPSYPFQRFS